jgi:hypothetical protein
MTTLPVLLSVLIALAGTGGIVFGALRYNRDEAGKVVTQQAQVLADMKLLNDELQAALARAREDIKNALAQNAELIEELRLARQEIGGLRVEVRRLHQLMEMESDGAG